MHGASIMGFVSRHRRCGCDCRDAAGFVVDPQTFNPLCCRVCAGGKPPCAYIANWECIFECSGPPTFANRANWIGYPGMTLRPVCPFENACQFVDDAVNNAPTWLDGCTWSERMEGNQFDTQTFLDAVNWTLDISAVPATMTHKNGYRFSGRFANVGGEQVYSWDCYGPNTLWSEGPYGSCPNMPKAVCITPKLTLAYPNEPRCCPRCFSLNITGMASIQVPDQNVTFFLAHIPVEDSSGNVISDACAYQAPIIAYGSSTGMGTATIWSFSPMRTADNPPIDQPTRAFMELVYYEGSVNINGNRSQLQADDYECDSFTCSTGGVFRFAAGHNPTQVPQELTVIPTACIRSENDDYGPCPSAGCPGIDQPTLPSNQQTADTSLVYNDEAERCECQDPWCECAPCAVKLFDSVTSDIWGTTSCGTGVPGFHGFNQSFGLCSPAGSIQGNAAGGVREIQVAVSGGHVVTARAYCKKSTTEVVDGITIRTPAGWVVEWYCDGTYVSTEVCQVVGTCPLKLSAGAPRMTGCNISGGCLAINCFECLTCVPVIPITCCFDYTPGATVNAPPTTLFLTVTSPGCPSLDGATVTLTWNGFAWAAFQINVLCQDSVWELLSTISGAQLDAPNVGSVTSLVCDPFHLKFEHVLIAGGPCDGMYADVNITE